MSRSKPSRRQASRTALRLAALATVSLGALACAAPAQAQLVTALTGGSTANTGPVKPLYGNISPFYGNISPFYGNISPFYGNLQPFYGNLKPFWGNLQPFWGDMNAFYGDLRTFWGVNVPVSGGAAGAPDFASVGTFWTNAGGSWDTLFSAWNPAAGQPNYVAVDGQLKSLVDSSRTFWGSAVTAKTGKSFDDGFANAVLGKYGINLADPTSLSKLDQTHQALFFLDWYDGLMNFSGTDHVDWWMKSVNWTPAVTQQQGYGTHTTIGLLDMTVVGDSTLTKNIVEANGISDFTNGHGAAVASLIIGPHDGQGTMGIAPGAQVVAYNPFDATGTAGWADITTGIQNLKASGASVVNASLGVPGMTFDQGWNNVFTDLRVALTLKNTVFVMAAGNEGAVQSKNITWTPLLTPAFLVVGSVDVTNHISNFSNTPGSACLVPLLGLCTGDYLRNHFLVAPGELILVSDGHGGTTRMTGTSFAAPLVSGAIALLQNRWPWLQNYPQETADILLNSAKDLGAPGVDSVYGHGLLDVTASQSPLDMNKLIWYAASDTTQQHPVSRQAVLTTYQSAQSPTWNAQGAYFYAFEPLGLLGLTKRDFAIPLSNKLIGQNVTTANGSQEQFQAYLLSRMDAWASSGGKNGLIASGFDHFASTEVAVANRWGADMTLSIAPRDKRQGYRDDGPDYQSALKIQGEKAGLTFGFGDGAANLMAGSGFRQAADYDAERGGANPLLGLASGGGFAGASYGLSSRLQISAGVLARDDHRDPNLLQALKQPGIGAASYQAAAQVLGASFKASDTLTFGATYTHLHEATGLLGVQSLDPADFRHGSTTDGYTLSANWAVAPKLSLMATGTLGRTRAGDQAGQQLAVAGDGLTSSAYAVGAQGHDLFLGGDRLQLTLSQPMTVERGHLNLTGVEVVDRQTGEIGVVTHSLDLAAKRRVAGEALYAWPVQDGHGYVALFGRAETGGDQTSGAQTLMAGARYRIAF